MSPVLSTFPALTHLATYNSPSIDPNYEIKPRLERQVLIRVPEHLKSVRSLDLGLSVIYRCGVETRYEAIQRAEKRHNEGLRRIRWGKGTGVVVGRGHLEVLGNAINGWSVRTLVMW